MADRNFVYIYAVLISAVFQTIVCKDVASYITFYKEVRLSQFVNFGSLQLLDIDVPPLALSVACDIRGLRNPHKCPVKSISVYWQHGSMPTVEYTGPNTFRKGFVLRRSYLGNISLPSNDTASTITLDRPHAGTWFLAAFVEKNDDQVIKKITNMDCSYGLQMNVTTSLLSSVAEVEPNKLSHLYLDSQDNIFRFFVSSNIYKYSIILTRNISSSSDSLVMSARGIGLPTDSEDTAMTNCSDINSSCSLQFISPAVDQWHYLQISGGLQNSTEDVMLLVKFYACERSASKDRRRTGSAAGMTTVSSAVSQSAEGSENALHWVPDREVNKSPGHLGNYSLEYQNASTGAPMVKSTVLVKGLDGGKQMAIAFDRKSDSVLNATHGENNLTGSANLSTAKPGLSGVVWNNGSENSNVIVDDVSEAGSFTAEPNTMSDPDERSRIVDEQCSPPARFSQVVDVDNMLSTVFSLQPMSSETLLILTLESPFVMRFDVSPMRDIGSTLKLQAGLHEVIETQNQNKSDESVYMKICIQRGSIPVDDQLALSCLSRGDDFLMTPANETLERYYPYPEPGPWFIGIQKVCYMNVSERVPCQRPGAVSLRVATSPCVDDGCGNSGNCVEYAKSVYTYAACQCIAGYRGFSCDDASEAANDDLQKLYSFLLSLSNLLFIPAIIVACFRRRFPEAVVYFANMFFSSFYHACDMSTWSRYKLCIMPYHVLSFCDFYCSMLSFWVTLTAMARLPVMLRHVAHLVGAIALAMAMKWNMHGVITNVLPIVVGIGIVIVSWGVRCGLLKRLFPHKRSLLWVIPGVILAGFGICLFAFIETDANYPYTHSVWHLCMSVSIVFLLPRSKVHVKDDSSSDSSSYKLDSSNEVNELIVADFNRLL